MNLHTQLVEGGAARLVFLHGLLGRGANFRSIATDLSGEATSLLIDAPNHAASPWTESVSYELMAQATAEEIRVTFGGRPVTLVGHSMGGKTAMVLALRYPELVDQLVVVDISPAARTSVGEFVKILAAMRAAPLSADTSRSDVDQALAGDIPQPGTRSFIMQNLKRTESGFAWQPNLDVLERDMREISGFPDVSDRSYPGPVLWVRGGKSDYIRDEDLPVMEQMFPDVVPVTISNAGHWVHAEQREAFVTLLREFLTQDATDSASMS